MTDKVHYIPVGFDFDRLMYPISKGDIEADKVILIDQKNDSSESKEASNLADRMVEKLFETFEMFDIEVEIKPIDFEDLYDYEELYAIAHDYLKTELEKENEVYTNISSMPRTVAFAFATAADSIASEYDDFRNSLHTYYVAPEQYKILPLLETADEMLSALEELPDDEFENIHEQENKLAEQLEDIRDSGITEGVRTRDGERGLFEIPASPGSNVQEFEGDILRFLYENGPTGSTSEIANTLSEDSEADNAFRSRVQYNVTRLDKKGYITREDMGNRYRTSLSTMGKMWVKTHIEDRK